MAEKPKAKRRKAKRVDLNSVNNKVPVVAPYPFMVDQYWLEEYVKKKGLTCKMRKKDLDGFGANFEQDVTF